MKSILRLAALLQPEHGKWAKWVKHAGTQPEQIWSLTNQLYAAT